MRKRVSGLFCAVLLGFGAQGAQAQDTTFKVFWKEGIRGESGDGDFKWKLGGRLQYDAAFFNQSDNNQTSFPKVHDGSEFRRARLELEGTIYQRFIFKTQYDFADGKPAIKDAYLGVTGIPYVGRVRLGQSIEPVSLDQISSSKYSEFMERGLTTAFAPDRNPGINFNNSFFDDRITYGLGVFRAGDDTTGNSGGDGSWNVAGRVTGLPWYEEEAKLVSIGVSGVFVDVSGQANFNARPETHLAPKMADTNFSVNNPATKFFANNYYTIVPEAVFLYGPFSLQGEYAFTNTEAPDVGNPNFNAFTVSASYWLTGENRSFKTATAEFDRVKPKINFLQGGTGLGAWEVALRYSYLDLTDSQITGGKISDVTAGVNWQWNPNMRLMLNYVHSDVEDKNKLSGTLNTYQIRAQVDF